MTWRDHFAPKIAEVLRLHPNDTPERKKALYDLWQFGDRKYHPYKIYLDEIAKQTGKKPRVKAKSLNVDQGTLI